jgi:hypothetical protein
MIGPVLLALVENKRRKKRERSGSLDKVDVRVKVKWQLGRLSGWSRQSSCLATFEMALEATQPIFVDIARERIERANREWETIRNRGLDAERGEDRIREAMIYTRTRHRSTISWCI